MVERHFREIDLLVELRVDALEAPDFDLDELSDELDGRLGAHIGALGFAGRAAIEAVVEPALQSSRPDASLGAAVALTILAVGTADDCERVVALLDPASVFGDCDADDLAALRGGVILGLGLSERGGVDDWLTMQLTRAMDDGHSPRAAALLAALGGRCRAPAGLAQLLTATDPQLLCAAASAARFARDDASATALARLASHPDAGVCAAALESALVRRVAGAWRVATYWAVDAPSCVFRRQALTWVAMLGSPAVHERLLARLAEPRDRTDLADSLWAAGFCGRPRAIELALAHLDDPELGPLAAELICAIAGSSVADDRFWLSKRALVDEEGLPPLALDDLDTDLSLRPELLLPTPNPEAFADWWAREGARLRAVPRLLHGGPWAIGGVLERLRHGALRRRHTWALELAIRSAGAFSLDTRGWAHRQFQQLHAFDPATPITVDGFGWDA